MIRRDDKSIPPIFSKYANNLYFTVSQSCELCDVSEQSPPAVRVASQQMLRWAVLVVVGGGAAASSLRLATDITREDRLNIELAEAVCGALQSAQFSVQTKCQTGPPIAC